MLSFRVSIRRAGCALLAAVFLGFCAAPGVGAETLQEKSARLKQEYEQAQKELDAINNNKKKAQQQKQVLENQRKITEEKIETLVAIINEQIEAIALKEQAIADKQTEIDGRWEDFKARMKTMQMMHDRGAVAMIASADSLYDLLTYSTTLQQISEKDNEVLEEMSAQKAALEEERQALETAKAEQEAAKAELDKTAEQLSSNIQQQNTNISKAAADAEAQSVVVSETKKKYEEAQAKFDAWVRQNSSNGSGVCAEGFIWPLPGYSNITTYFGGTQNLGGYITSGHKGIDVPAPKGTPILAAHDGTVKSTTGDWTYGNVVMLDNGDGVTTVYAHMSSIAVGVGQQVSQGDVIGYVGSTGNSTGNHLHWEVQINGVRQNPLNYASP
ncbi:murein hydrolase activator EnvC family protein [Allofournierella sp.]|uniref:murein hydrolase activator EnvC family protein n=2 Tax=Allofournierella sp. TaxID=1940256 RepID=UPI003AF4D5FA